MVSCERIVPSRSRALQLTLDRDLDLLEHSGRHHAGAPSAVRRELNQAMFERFWLIDDEIGDAKFSERFDQLHAPQDATLDEDGSTNERTGSQRTLVLTNHFW